MATEIEDLERRLYQALAASDVAVLAELLSDDLVHVHPAGVSDTKQEYLAGHRSGAFRQGAVRRLDGDTRVHEGVAVTAGAIEVDAVGSPEPLRLEQTLVWADTGDGWRLLVRQTTKSVRT